MTDKQIIIDSIDVSECEFYKGYCRITSLCDYSGHLCEVTSNCYYKQLKRAQNQIVDFNKMVDAKEQECEELKRQHQADKGLITSIGKQNYQLLQEYNKLKTTLTKIKEIALGVRNYLDCPSPKDVRYEMDIILQKISEVEDER